VDGEIVVERRRQWTPEEKAALMAEVEAEGGHASSLPSGTGSRRARCTIGDRPGRPPVWQREQSRPVGGNSFSLVSLPTQVRARRYQ
jgi:hypothetical protein